MAECKNYCPTCGCWYNEDVCPICGDDTQIAVEKTHPGFDVICQRCESSLVYVESDIGCSEASGMWGEVRLICLNCSQEITIFEPA